MMTERGGRYWLRLGIFTLVIVVVPLVCMLLYLVQRQLDILVTPFRMPLTQTPADIGLPYQEVSLTSRDGLEIAGWYIPGSRPYAVILVHGINSNRQVMLPAAAILAEAGYHLLLIDMRGHGQSGDSLLSYGYREALDVQAAVDYLAGLSEIEKIGVLGSSMGGAAAARAAAIEPRLAAVVVERSYSSLPDALNDAFDDFAVFPDWAAPPVIFLAEQRVGLEIEQVDSARDLAGMSPRPVMIIHGQNDSLLPLYHAEKMYAAAGEPKDLWVIEGLILKDPAIEYAAEYRERVVGFFERAFANHSENRD